MYNGGSPDIHANYPNIGHPSSPKHVLLSSNPNHAQPPSNPNYVLLSSKPNHAQLPSHPLPSTHPFAASITPATKVWTAPPPPPLIDWDIVCPPTTPPPPMSPTPTPTGRKRALALLKPKAKSADSPHPKTKAPKFKTKSLPLVASPRPPFSSSIASPPRPSLSSSMGSPKTPKSNKSATPTTTPRGSLDTPASPASSAGPLTPPSFLRRLPSLPNLRRKRSTEFNSFCQPPIGYEWVPLYHEPEHTEQVSTTEIESVQSLPIPKSYVSEPYASEPYDLVTSPDFEPSNTHPDAPETKPDTHIPDAPGTTPNTADTQSYPPDKRTRRQGRIFTPGFADALRAELECRCPTPCRDAGAFDDTQDMVAQLCAFGII